MKKWVMLALFLIIPNISFASVSADFFVATDTAATSSFSGAASVDGVFKLGSATGILSTTNGYVGSTPNFVYNAATGFLGVGTSTQYAPNQPWEFAADTTAGTAAVLDITNYDTNNPQASLNFRGARGTRTSASALLKGNTLGAIGFGGFDGAGFNFVSPIRIIAAASENWTTAARGSQLNFFTTANGTTTRALTMQLNGRGDLYVTGSAAIGTTTELVSPGLTVDGEIITTGNIQTHGFFGAGPVTPIYPLDVSSEATTSIRIDSTSGSQGSCIILKDSDGSGYSYITANDGVLTASMTPCS